MSEARTLYYVHDPMCSWCWAFVPTWEQIQRELPNDIEVVYLLGGLAPDSDEAKVLEKAKIKAIQEGYYLNAKKPSDFDTLIAFAEEIGLDVERFEIALNSESTIEKLNEEMYMARSIGAQGFPSLILKSNKFAEAEETKSQALKEPQWQNVPYDYNDASVTLRRL
mgnify:FL=1